MRKQVPEFMVGCLWTGLLPLLVVCRAADLGSLPPLQEVTSPAPSSEGPTKACPARPWHAPMWQAPSRAAPCPALAGLAAPLVQPPQPQPTTRWYLRQRGWCLVLGQSVDRAGAALTTMAIC